MKYESCPWVGVSPDGILTYKTKEGVQKWDLIEYKCPARFKQGINPYLKHKYGVPPYYMAQIQGIMGFLNLHSSMKFERAWFVVWIPDSTFFTQVNFHQNYFDELKSRLESWYFKKFLPRVFLEYKKDL